LIEKSTTETMLEMFIFETSQYLEQMEQLVISSEKANGYTQTTIDEVFRIMHNIKSSSAMMLLNNISLLAHSIEDLFFVLREQKPQNVDNSTLTDLVFEGVDFIKVEMEKVKNGDATDGDNTTIIGNIKKFLAVLKQQPSMQPEENIQEKSTPKQQWRLNKDDKAAFSNTNSFRAVVYFQEGCQMENIRAYSIIHHLKEVAQEIHFIPEDIIENDNSVQVIREHGFIILFKADSTYDEMQGFFDHIAFIKDLELVQIENDDESKLFHEPEKIPEEDLPVSGTQLSGDVGTEEIEFIEKDTQNNSRQSIISVNVNKLDMLMDLVGEMVIAEAMVTQNPDLKGLELDSFKKAARQLRKITGEVQDIVMSIRMVPLTITFQKMNRIVRDMSKRLDKEVILKIVGEETEVDKNIIEHISDPLMHLVRNAIDHGLENSSERKRLGKTEPAQVVIEAKNEGSEVLVTVRDNGKGLDKEKILKRARENELLHKSENEMTDREIYNLIFLPGFSTKENITEFSGRGVGMDVVTKNIETIGGCVLVDSIENEGTSITLKIPLTLAIINGMNIRVGKSCYTIPLTAIKESFRPNGDEIFTDPDGREMIMVRGQCYSILRIHEAFKVKTDITGFTKGIIIMVENDGKTLCLFADALLGEQQVVVKTLPSYIRKMREISGLSGCTLLGDGSISLILDIARLLEGRRN